MPVSVQNFCYASSQSSNGDEASILSVNSYVSLKSISSPNPARHQPNTIVQNAGSNRVPSFDQKKFKAAAAGYYEKYRTRVSISDRRQWPSNKIDMVGSAREAASSQKEEPQGPSKCVEDSIPDMCFSSRSRSSLASRSSRMRITPECSTTRSEAKEMILRVEDSIRTASDQLGSSHSLVESARRELRRLKTEERKTRQDEVLHFHTAVVGEAMEAGDIEALEAACQSAVLASSLPATLRLLLPVSLCAHAPPSRLCTSAPPTRRRAPPHATPPVCEALRGALARSRARARARTRRGWPSGSATRS